MCGQFLVAGRNLKVMFSIKGNLKIMFSIKGNLKIMFSIKENLKVMFSIKGNLKVMKKNERRFPQHFISLARFHNKI